MSEEEKEAIKETKQVIEKWNDTNWLISYDHKNLEILLNLIDKLQKENEQLKEKINKVVLMIDDNYSSKWYDDYETIAGLRDDIYDLLKNKYKGVKDDN